MKYLNCLCLDNSIARNRHLWGEYNFSCLISHKYSIRKSLANQGLRRIRNKEIILFGTANKPPLVSFQPFFFRGNVVYVVVLFYQLMKTLSIPPRQRFSAMFMIGIGNKILLYLVGREN